MAFRKFGLCYLARLRFDFALRRSTSPNLKRTPFVRIVLGFFFALFRLLPCRITPLYCYCNAFRVFGGFFINHAQTAVYAAKAA